MTPFVQNLVGFVLSINVFAQEFGSDCLTLCTLYFVCICSMGIWYAMFRQTICICPKGIWYLVSGQISLAWICSYLVNAGGGREGRGRGVQSHCIAQHCIALYCNVLHCIALHYTQHYCTVLHCTTLDFTALH